MAKKVNGQFRVNPLPKKPKSQKPKKSTGTSYGPVRSTKKTKK